MVDRSKIDIETDLVHNFVHVDTPLAPVPAVLRHGPRLHLVYHYRLLQLLGSLVAVLLGVEFRQGQAHNLGQFLLGRFLLL